MKTRLLMLAVLAVMLFSMVAVSSPVYATTPTPTPTPAVTITGKVLVWRANIRATDSIRSKRLTTVKYRTVLTILGRDKVGGWLKVQLPDGMTIGWLRTIFVRLNKGVLRTLPIVS